MKVIGISSCGSVMLEAHARQVRMLKEAAAHLVALVAELPDIECSEDGRVSVLSPLPAAENPPAAAPQRPATGRKPARTGDDKAQVPKAVCKVCSKPFEVHRPGQETCSEKCCKQWYSMRKRGASPAAALKQGETRTCLACRKPFIPRRKDQTCCTKECRDTLPRPSHKRQAPPAAPPTPPPAPSIPPKAARLETLKRIAQRLDPVERIERQAAAQRMEDDGL